MIEPRVEIAERARAERALAEEIAALVRANPATVLGVATGSTPVGVYRELARIRREERLDFARVVAFNLDEYFDLPPDHPATFRAWTRERIVEPLGLRPENMHGPASRVATGKDATHLVRAECERYERAIRDAGGIDLQILGLGRNGHVAFNEPGSGRETRTRLVELHEETRADAATAFPAERDVPSRAITMGVATILEARRLRVLAFGSRKARVVLRFLRDAVGPEIPATFLREHPDLHVRLDREAAAELVEPVRRVES